MTSQQHADIGLIGLAVMGQNLVLNMADHGFNVAVYNRTTSKMTHFVNQHPPDTFSSTGGRVQGHEQLHDFVNAIAKPRKIVILVKAGKPTNAVIDQLIPLLDEDDIVIDGGNAHWNDSIAAQRKLAQHNLRYIGSGVSGGEEGARFGPSLMPGGDESAWQQLKPIWEAIAAKVDPESGKPLEGARPQKPVNGGVPCTTYIGPDGAGHFVKMVHNGIEYGDMQMICEAFHLLRAMADIPVEECADIFSSWNNGDLDSFLIEITADILRFKDPRTGKPFVDVVLDAAENKGTGKWTTQAALDHGTPTATIAEAVFARFISAFKDERVRAAKTLTGPSTDDSKAILDRFFKDKDSLVNAVGNALYCAKVCSYAQGFHLMRDAARQHDWTLHYGNIAAIFRGGCIIRARFLQRITDAYSRDPELPNLLLDPFFKQVFDDAQHDWRSVNAAAQLGGVPIPAFASALSYYDAYRHETLPATLLQAQRDYFGAHTYERTDQQRGNYFHIDWPHPERPEHVA